MTGSGGRPLVLVIEDDLRYVRQLRADLAVGDFRAVFAGTGARGLDGGRYREAGCGVAGSWDCLIMDALVRAAAVARVLQTHR